MNEKTYKINITNTQLALLLHFMDQLSEYYSNGRCNDLPEKIRDMFTKEEGEQIANEFAVYNNPKNPEGPGWPIFDSCLLYWLQRKIQDQCKD